MDCHGLSWTVMDYHRLSKTIMTNFECRLLDLDFCHDNYHFTKNHSLTYMTIIFNDSIDVANATENKQEETRRNHSGDT